MVDTAYQFHHIQENILVSGMQSGLQLLTDVLQIKRITLDHPDTSKMFFKSPAANVPTVSLKAQDFEACSFDFQLADMLAIT